MTRLRDLAIAAASISLLAAGPALAQTNYHSAQPNASNAGISANTGSQFGVGGATGTTSNTGLSGENSQQMAQNLPKNEIEQVQQKLKQDGYYKGRVDGIWGPETSQAMQQFQQAKGMQSEQQALAELGVGNMNGAGSQNGALGAAPGSGQGASSAINSGNAGSMGTGTQMNAPASNGTSSGSLGAGTSGTSGATANPAHPMTGSGAAQSGTVGSNAGTGHSGGAAGGTGTGH